MILKFILGCRQSSPILFINLTIYSFINLIAAGMPNGREDAKEYFFPRFLRFPEDFMFELSKEEFKNLRSQFVTSSWGGIRYRPLVFTEQGVAMLSSVLHSEKAIKINIKIMRAFSRYRALLMENSELHYKIDVLEEKVNKVFKLLTKRIDALHRSKTKKTPLGFKV